MLDILAAFSAGMAWGYFVRWYQSRPDRPLRMVRFDVISPVKPPIDTLISEEWKIRLQAWTLWAEYCGLSELGMVKAGIVTSRGYRRFAGVLKDAGILISYPRSRTHYAPGWCGAKVRSFLRRGKLSLPYPPQPPPPVHTPASVDRRFSRWA